MNKYELLSVLAMLQRGHVAAWQCRVLGLPGSWVHDQINRRGWSHVREGVYRLPGVAETWQGSAWAGLLATAGPSARRGVHLERPGEPAEKLRDEVAERALVTAWSAAAAWGHDRVAPAHPQLLLPQGTQCLRSDVNVTRTRLFPDYHEDVDGMPCAPPERVLWDAAWIGRRGRGADRSLHDLAVYFDRSRIFAITELLGVVEEPVSFGLPRRVPSMLRRTAERLSPGFSHSATEDLARRIVCEVVATRGLVASARPYPISADGRIIAEADIAVASLRWDLEIDGPHHEGLEMRDRDARRDMKLARIDWTTSRYPTTLLDRSQLAFAEMVDHDLDIVIERRRSSTAA